MNRPVNPNSSIEMVTKASASFSSQLLATKFFVPVTSGTLISRSRLIALLDKGLKYPFTLVSAPAGFGKTTLLATWAQSLSVSTSRLCWISLDEEDNDPQLFWTSVLSALDRQLPNHFAPLLLQLQSPSRPPLKQLLAALINLLVESMQHFVLILDDYQVITQEQVHTTLSYLVQHLPSQLRIIIATRADPPLPLPMQRARHHLLEVRTDQLRCTVEETRAFFHEVIGIHLPDETIQQIGSRTEGWLVGLQLLGLSLPDRVNPEELLKEISGDQRYILDYLTEEVLRRQPQEVQMFLLSTSILEQFNASLCDAVMEQHESQQMLHQLEQANLFVVSLDSRRQWYRYHALFAEALQHQLEQTQPHLTPLLHHRASLWYAQHNQTTQAILHALRAKEWQWAADLIEGLSVSSLTWGAGEHELVLLRQWLEQLPKDIVQSRPRLCLACAHLSWQFAPSAKLEAWLDAAEATLAVSLATPTDENISHPMLAPQTRQAQENLLGEVTAFRATLQSHQEDGYAVFSLCQKALALLSPEHSLFHIQIACAQFYAYYTSAANDATRAIQRGLQGISLAQTAGYTSLAINLMNSTALHMIGIGQLREAQQLVQQALVLGKLPTGALLPDVGWSMVLQAEILRELNQLDGARKLVEDGIVLCKQIQSMVSRFCLLCGYSVQLRLFLSCGEWETSHAALQQFDQLGQSTNQHLACYMRSMFTLIDQVRLWLASRELDRATQWVEGLDLLKTPGTLFAHEREEVARVRVLLATKQPTLALERLELVLQRATAGQRWGHVIEMRLLQAMAHQMHGEETQALDILSEAIRLAEPEGYIRSFVDEGLPMEALLSRLREQQRQAGPTPYLDTLLSAFPQQSPVQERQPKPEGERTKTQPQLNRLSERELEVLQLLVHGASNQQIAQELVIALDTVKRHVSHIFAKLGVNNRVQAVRQAQELGLLDEAP